MQYPAKFEQGDTAIVVTFRDIPEAITQGKDFAEALDRAQDVLVSSMDFYFDDRQSIPPPSPPQDGERLVDLPLSVAAKVLLLNEMLAQNVRPVDLARKLHTTPQEVTRMIDLSYRSKIDTIGAALAVLGRRLDFHLA